jgi:hypothetical protein
MGIRSIAIVPLHRQGRAFGLLEVFSSVPDAFNDDDLSVLQLMAALLATEISRIETKPQAESAAAELEETVESEEDPAPTAQPSFAGLENLYPAEPKQITFLDNRKLIGAIAGVIIAALLIWFAFSALSSRSRQQAAAAATPAPKPVQVPASVASVDDLKAAADRGDAQAQFALGVKYASGNEFPHDDKEAAKWINLSAEQGYQEAQTMLSLFYSAGRGVPKDLVQAYKWSAIAASKGDTAGAGQIRFLKTIMQPDEIKAADKAANEWLMDRQPLPVKQPVQ